MLATRNVGKLLELRALFAAHDIAVIDLREASVPEDLASEERIEAFETFEENALAKAQYFAAMLPGHTVVADDSGLAVDALGGEPGVRSKRWSGSADSAKEVVDAANNAMLVARLRGVDERGARFVCAAAWCDGVSSLVVRGEVEGRIVDIPVGAHGFGYDPHVFVDELAMTLAQASIAEKQQVSHRARAFERLLDAVHADGRTRVV